MTSPLTALDTTAASLLELMHRPGSPYRLRLSNRLAACLSSAGDGADSLLVIAPPWLDLVAFLGGLLEDLERVYRLHDCRLAENDWSGADGAGSGELPFLVLPKQLDASGQQRLAAELARSGPRLYLSVFPPAVPAKRPPRAMLVDYRDLCYERSDLDYLIENSQGLLGAGPGGDPLSSHELLRYTQGWPLLTELVVARLSASANGTTPAAHRLPLVAGEPEVQAILERAWRPLLLRYPWLAQVAELPMLNLDLLQHLFADAVNEVPDCLALGVLNFCNRRAGFYQLSPLFEGMLLARRNGEVNESLLQEAARWYQGHGYLSEAIECLVAGGAGEDILAALRDDVGDKTPRRKAVPVAGVGQLSQVARAAVSRGGSPKPPFLESPSASRRSELASPAQDPAMAPELALVLQAYRHHCAADSQGVGSAVAAAVESGVNRRQLSSLVDFVDIHIRPLLRNSDTPLGYALKDVRHSAPAREAVAAQYQSLNHRESQILQRICEGYKNREISEQLGLELSTIKWYSTRIYEKLKVKNRTQAVARAQVLGLFA